MRNAFARFTLTPEAPVSGGHYAPYNLAGTWSAQVEWPDAEATVTVEALETQFEPTLTFGSLIAASMRTSSTSAAGCWGGWEGHPYSIRVTLVSGRAQEVFMTVRYPERY